MERGMSLVIIAIMIVVLAGLIFLVAAPAEEPQLPLEEEENETTVEAPAAAAAAGSDEAPTGSCLDFANATQVILGGQGTAITAVIMLTVIIIAIAYAFGSASGNANYIVFAKDEGYHLGFSVVLLMIIGGIITFSCLTLDMFYNSMFDLIEVDSQCYAPGLGMNQVSSCYIEATELDAKHLAEDYIDQYIGKLMDSTYAYTIQLPLLNAYTSTAGAYKRIVSNQYDIVLNSFLIPALMSISMQKLAVNFINKEIIEWILPSAFLLRVFIPTRSMGNMLIALAVGLYVIVPFMYVFNLTMYDAVFTEEDCLGNIKYKSALCDNVVDSYSCSATCSDTNECNTACTNPNGFLRVARLVPQAFFLPNLTIAIIITFLAGINKALRVIG